MTKEQYLQDFDFLVLLTQDNTVSHTNAARYLGLVDKVQDQQQNKLVLF